MNHAATSREWDLDRSFLDFDECLYARNPINKQAEHVTLTNENKQPVDRSRLNQALLRSMDPDRVRTLDLSYESQLTELPDLTPFRKLEGVRVESQVLKTIEPLANVPTLQRLKMKEAPARLIAQLPTIDPPELEVSGRRKGDRVALAACKNTTRLEMYDWGDSDLTMIKHLPLNILHLYRGMAESTHGIEQMDLAMLRLDSCRRLIRFAKSKVASLWVFGRFEWDELRLSNLEGLKEIWISCAVQIDSLGFLKGCDSLKGLTITATRVETDRLDVLGKLRSLAVVWISLPIIPAPVIEAFVKKYPQIAFAEADRYFVKGREVEGGVYFKVQDQAVGMDRA